MGDVVGLLAAPEGPQRDSCLMDYAVVSMGRERGEVQRCPCDHLVLKGGRALLSAPRLAIGWSQVIDRTSEIGYPQCDHAYQTVLPTVAIGEQTYNKHQNAAAEHESPQGMRGFLPDSVYQLSLPAMELTPCRRCAP